MRGFVTAAALAGAISAGGAWAGDDHDTRCALPMAQWHSREAVALMAEARGWKVRRIKTDDGCYEVDGWNAEGRQIEAYVNPGSLEVIAIKVKDDDTSSHANGRER